MDAPMIPTWKPEIGDRVVVGSTAIFAGAVGIVRCVWQFPNANIITVAFDFRDTLVRYYDSELALAQVVEC